MGSISRNTLKTKAYDQQKRDKVNDSGTDETPKRGTQNSGFTRAAFHWRKLQVP